MKEKSYQQIQQEKIRAEGRCIRCWKKRQKNKCYCNVCVKKMNARRREFRKEKKEQK